MYIKIFLPILQMVTFFQGCLCSTNSSWEHRIRAHLLEDYDRKVRPVLRGKKQVVVNFALKISRLVHVDNQEQVLVLDTWVIQQWNNEFLQWNASEYGDTARVHFSPKEIWVPDIALYNNGDDQINLAGGPSKFVTDVAVRSTGECIWSGPATFKVNCEMQIHRWPFDEQECRLAFGSYTYGDNLLKIKLFKAKKQITNRFVESGNWKIEEITPELSETDHGNCCRFKFNEVVYIVRMKRKPLYYTFYLTIPCVILTVIALSSFLIHVESGERVGFVTTVLLSFTVFLLMIPSFLPVTSDGVPVLGVLLEGTMIIITLVLFANIFVVWVYFQDGEPPEWVQKINRFCGKRQKARKTKKIQAAEAESLQPALDKSATTPCSLELTGLKSVRRMENEQHIKETQRSTWQTVSIKLDRGFFVLFLVVALVSYSVYFKAAV
ncbi:neuronal acetylcholine receptor subunit alpha-7-like [Montipora foliosa]|uniref:neuronal acetylcholine receptor subunit alpha-7-like n=1 Tax=Montipora foliosa TaxID=591990 RepID=UPI0035F21048